MDEQVIKNNKWIKGQYHYEFFCTECVECGDGEKWKEHVVGPRPKDDQQVYHYEQYVCDWHFM